MNTEPTELLTCSELDDVCECQHNLDESELPMAIDALSLDQLAVLRTQCTESVQRQNRILDLLKAEPTAGN